LLGRGAGERLIGRSNPAEMAWIGRWPLYPSGL